MHKNRMKSLKEDYKHFAFTLLAVSTFLYIGAVLPDQGLTLGQKSTMFLADCVFLAGLAFFCADRSLIYKKRLEEADE
nr:YrhC family protein [Bacillus subtilis]